jgi:hypothetical protein
MTFYGHKRSFFHQKLSSRHHILSPSRCTVWHLLTFVCKPILSTTTLQYIHSRILLKHHTIFLKWRPTMKISRKSWNNSTHTWRTHRLTWATCCSSCCVKQYSVQSLFDLCRILKLIGKRICKRCGFLWLSFCYTQFVCVFCLTHSLMLNVTRLFIITHYCRWTCMNRVNSIIETYEVVQVLLSILLVFYMYTVFSRVPPTMETMSFKHKCILVFYTFGILPLCS